MCTVQLHGKHVISEFDTALILFSFNILPPLFIFHSISFEGSEGIGVFAVGY